MNSIDQRRSEAKAAWYHVLGIGAVAVDDVLYVDCFPKPDEKCRVNRYLRRCGGLTGTALLAASAWGACCGYAGWLGNDSLSQFVAERFATAGVDTSWARNAPGGCVAHSTVIVESQRPTRTVLAYLSGEVGPVTDWPPGEQIAAAGTLLVDHHNLQATLRAVRIARDCGTPVVADFERLSGDLLREIVPLVDHLVVGVPFARQWTGSDRASPERLASALWSPHRAAVVVTAGARGCWYRSKGADSVQHQPALPVAANDTTGCGDVFHGIYAAELAAGRTIECCVRSATAAAAVRACGGGEADGIPSRAEIEQVLASLPR